MKTDRHVLHYGLLNFENLVQCTHTALLPAVLRDEQPTTMMYLQYPFIIFLTQGLINATHLQVVQSV